MWKGSSTEGIPLWEIPGKNKVSETIYKIEKKTSASYKQCLYNNLRISWIMTCHINNIYSQALITLPIGYLLPQTLAYQT